MGSSAFFSVQFGKKSDERLKKGIFISLFVDGSNEEIIAVGAEYLRIERALYFGIGLLFIFYGYCRVLFLKGCRKSCKG